MIKRVLIFSLIVLSGCSRPAPDKNSEAARVITGLEVFTGEYAKEYSGKSALLVTNHSGVDFDLNQNITLLRNRGIVIKTVLAPEHGLYGFENDYDENHSFEDKNLGIKVVNMHKLSQGDIQGLTLSHDFVIYDIQDMGMRCYTYISNLKSLIDAMHRTATELVLLDRPNPISFIGTDGAFLDQKYYSRFISAFPAPFIYNMTTAEAALYYTTEFARDINLRIVKMKNYSSGTKYTSTMLPWVPPSPNLPDFNSSVYYTFTVLMEGINISLGRGTTNPFEYIGAPWIEPDAFCAGLKKLGIKNMKFRPVYFMPSFSLYKGKRCGGAQIFFTGEQFSPTEISYKLIAYIFKNYKDAIWSGPAGHLNIDYLSGTDEFRKNIEAGNSFEGFSKAVSPAVIEFEAKRKKYILY